MTKIASSIAVGVVLVGAVSSVASAALFIDEPYNYAVGSNLLGQTPGAASGLTGSWGRQGGNTINVVNTAPAYPGLQTSAKGVTTGDYWYNNYITSATSLTSKPSFWVSFVMVQTADPSTNATAGYNVGASDNWGNNSVTIGDANGYWGVAYYPRGAALSTYYPSSVQVVNGTPVFLAAKITPGGGVGGKDLLQLFIDPTPGGAEPTTSAVTLDSQNLNLGSNYIMAVGGSDSGGAVRWTLGEFRAGDTFADVAPASTTDTPEPASLGLLAIGALGLLKRRR